MVWYGMAWQNEARAVSLKASTCFCFVVVNAFFMMRYGWFVLSFDRAKRGEKEEFAMNRLID